MGTIHLGQNRKMNDTSGQHLGTDYRTLHLGQNRKMNDTSGTVLRPNPNILHLGQNRKMNDTSGINPYIFTFYSVLIFI